MNGTDLPKAIYWDACIYLAWLKGETQHGDECLEAIRQLAKENFEKKVVIVTSTLTFVEVLSSSLDDAQERQFRRSFRNQDHVSRDLDPPVALKARDFRQNLLKEKQKTKKTLATPDAIHLATASIYAGEFWTFDDGKRDKRHFGLLELDRHAGLDGLKICKPYRAQAELGLKI